MRERFAQLARRDALAQVLAGLEELEKYPTIRPIKVNAVAMRGFTEAEVLDFARLARRKPYVIRWIEFMPLDADQIWRQEDILTGGEIKAIIESEFGPLQRITTGDTSETARRYTFADGIGEVGFINPVSEPFCSTVRSHSPDRRRPAAHLPLRPGGNRSTRHSALRARATTRLPRPSATAVWHKELKHYIGDKRFRRTARSMSMIGG